MLQQSFKNYFYNFLSYFTHRLKIHNLPTNDSQFFIMQKYTSIFLSAVLKISKIYEYRWNEFKIEC